MRVKEITSLKHPLVHQLFQLRTVRKVRYEQRQIVLSGTKLIEEIQQPLQMVLKLKDYPCDVKAEELFYVTFEILKKITGLLHPEGIAAVIKMPPWDPLKNKKHVLGLDGISDPGNLGTLLRTACGLGWEGVYMTSECADPFNDKALRSAKGATFRLPLLMTSKEEMLSWIKEESMHPLVADIQGKPLQVFLKKSKIFLILGSESHGSSFKSLFEKIAIPLSQMESLNVAAAGAILMHGLK